jgi:hypothetical protein
LNPDQGSKRKRKRNSVKRTSFFLRARKRLSRQTILIYIAEVIYKKIAYAKPPGPTPAKRHPIEA